MERREMRGGNGPREMDKFTRVFVNMGSSPYTVESGYSTVANGYAEAIICRPGRAVTRLTRATPYDFAVWVEEDRETALMEARKRGDVSYIRWNGKEKEEIDFR